MQRLRGVLRAVLCGGIACAVGVCAAACTAPPPPLGSGSPTPSRPAAAARPTPATTATPVPAASATGTATPPPPAAPAVPPPPAGSGYPWHTDIAATTFWVGEIFDPGAEDGSQMLSTYDSQWFESYGGCDGVVDGDTCETEQRFAADGYFPRHMSPRENPFYLDLPFDDVNDPEAFAMRGSVIPWAGQPQYAGSVDDPDVSLMKNRWVQLRNGSRVCYGQIEDAGPGEYHDAAYVFGANDARPANTRYGGAGLDVSPALNGCLGFTELDGDSDRVDWAFVDDSAVPDGPWLRLVTTSGVQ